VVRVPIVAFGLPGWFPYATLALSDCLTIFERF